MPYYQLHIPTSFTGGDVNVLPSSSDGRIHLQRQPAKYPEPGDQHRAIRDQMNPAATVLPDHGTKNRQLRAEFCKQGMEVDGIAAMVVFDPPPSLDDEVATRDGEPPIQGIEKAVICRGVQISFPVRRFMLHHIETGRLLMETMVLFTGGVCVSTPTGSLSASSRRKKAQRKKKQQHRLANDNSENDTATTSAATPGQSSTEPDNDATTATTADTIKTEEQPTPTAAFAFMFCSRSASIVDGPLESTGPTGLRSPAIPTQDRAELRGLLAALQFRVWYGEGWNRVVLVTSSDYVFEGCTSHLRNWRRNGWKSAKGTEVANRDMWETVVEIVDEYVVQGCQLAVWRVKKGWNKVVIKAARDRAEAVMVEGGEGETGSYHKVSGVQC